MRAVAPQVRDDDLRRIGLQGCRTLCEGGKGEEEQRDAQTQSSPLLMVESVMVTWEER